MEDHHSPADEGLRFYPTRDRRMKMYIAFFEASTSAEIIMLPMKDVKLLLENLGLRTSESISRAAISNILDRGILMLGADPCRAFYAGVYSVVEKSFAYRILDSHSPVAIL